MLRLLSSHLSLSSSKSYGGHETSWKYEGADGIVFNEVRPELHLPLSRHLSDQRPLHRLEHPSRNWRESRSQESVRLICDNGYSDVFSVSSLSLRCTHVVIARCNKRTRGSTRRKYSCKICFFILYPQSRNMYNLLNDI